MATHFSDIKHDVASLGFCSIELVARPARGGDDDLLLKTKEAFLDIYFTDFAPNGLDDELLLNVA